MATKHHIRVPRRRFSGEYIVRIVWKDNNRVVIDCPHTGGHTGHPDVQPPVISKFISENPTHVLSPYLTGGYADFPDSCVLRLP